MVYNLQKEKQEAIDAGNRALRSLENARNDLQSARTWGVFDMLGGGTFTTFIKRNNMHKAQSNMQKAKYDLQSFSKELQDVSMNFNLNIDTDDFLSFADYFFDSFFVDWMVQDKINKALDRVNSAIYKVNDALKQLNQY